MNGRSASRARRATTSAARADAVHPPHRVRIIGGRWKRTPVEVVDLEGLRPTPDRVRETLFNWLGQDLTGRSCLDLFAGTAVLSLEAASRGAASVVCIERDRTACAAIERAIARLDASMVELLRMDATVALDQLAAQGRTFDVVFADPPFRAGWIERILPRMARLLTGYGAVYLESERAVPDDEARASDLACVRRGRAGQVHYHLLKPL